MSSDSLIHCSSEPDLNKALAAKSESVGAELCRRTKRKRTDESDSNLQSIMTEMRSMFATFKDEQNEKFETICATMEDLKSAFEFTTQKYNSALEQIQKLEQERISDGAYIRSLEGRLESYERHTRSSCLEFRNIPSSQPEPKDTLLKTIITTVKVLDISLTQSDIKDVYRISTSKDSTSKTIIVDFVSTLLKEKVLNQYKKHNRDRNRLTTEHIRLSGPAKPIFISENLTAYMKRIFFLARDFAKSNHFNFCWVKNGRIYIRKREGASVIRINDEKDLAQIQATE